MAQENILELAKQGNPEAIATLMNRSLHPKGITAKAALKDSCLQVRLESAHILSQQELIPFVRKGITGLGVEFIKTVRVYGQQEGEDFPAWTEQLDLGSQPGPNLQAQKQTSTKSQYKGRGVQKNDNLISTRSTLQGVSPSVNPRTTVAHDGINFQGREKQLGIIGSIVLSIGVFTPIVSVPIVGSLNYFNNGRGDGAILLVLAVVSLALTFREEYKWLWVTGLSSVGLISVGFLGLLIQISEVKASMDRELEGNPFRGLADAVIQSFQIQWGWGILFIGAGLIIAAAVLKEPNIVEDTKTSFTKLSKPKESKEVYIIASIVGLGLILLLLNPGMTSSFGSQTEGLSQANKARQSEGKQRLSAINSMQQAFQIDNDRFALTLEELEVGFISETENYQYEITGVDQTKALVTAAARSDELKSYIGAVFVLEDGTAVGATCETDQPLETPPDTPELIGSTVSCPANSSPL